MEPAPSFNKKGNAAINMRGASLANEAQNFKVLTLAMWSTSDLLADWTLDILQHLRLTLILLFSVAKT